MGFSQLGRSDAGFFGDFFRDYKNRMEAVAPFEAGIEAEGIDFPGRDEIIQKYQDYRQSGGSSLSQAARNLVEAYIPYRDRVARELSQRGFPDIQSGLENFERETGVVDYSDGRVSTYEYEQPLHELLSHQRPYDLGMAPDYRDFYAGTDPEGNPVVVKSNPITPINEDLATDLDVSRSRGLRNRDLTNQTSSITSGGFTDLLMSELNKREVLDDASRRLLPARMELQYPTRIQATGSEVFPPTERVTADVDRAFELLKDKYINPANQRLAGLLATQFPGISTKVTGLNDVEQFLALVEQYEGKPTDRSKYFYGTFLPGATPETVNRIAGNIRRTPSSLLPGVADLIPSAEAVRRGYQEGPQAMGEQMAKDFVEGLPVAATLAPVLSTPAVAPLAPGIGLGLLTVAGGETLNEIVKQQTGKPLVQRFQETAGAIGGDTTVIGRPRQPLRQPSSSYVTPQITQTPPEVVRQMNAQLNAQKNENEFQRRIRLAGEARQLDPWDFGITELLFGR
jgi:hypothetical protein